MKSSKAASGFESYYTAIFGLRWDALKAELSKPTRHVARINAFADRQLAETHFEALPKFPWAPHCHLLNESRSIQKDSSGLSLFYPMDAASLFPPLLLNVMPGESILDLCSAPGGKTLILAEAWKGEGVFIANDRSATRKQRLKTVLKDYLPATLFEKIKVTGFDGSSFGLHQKEMFDAVLLDAPCSSERHVFQDPKELALWSPSRGKNLSIQQYSLLCSGLQALRPGGRLVYSTCALNPAENDFVIDKLLHKKKHPVRVEPIDLEIGSATKHGWQILPDQGGWGPMYFCKLWKDGPTVGGKN